MTAGHPLFEFMPYGAPELIAAQRQRFSRALALASGMAVALFALANTLGLKLADPTPIEVRLRENRSTHIDRPPSLRVQERLAPRAVEGYVPPSPFAFPVPVPETALPALPAQDLGSTDGLLGDQGITGEAVGTGGGVSLADDPIPERGVPVSVDEMPVLLTIVKPKYPDLARDAMIEGRVNVHMLIGKDGRVVRAEVDSKFSVPLLNESALVSARQWVFTPAKRNGRPVMVWVSEMFVYRID